MKSVMLALRSAICWMFSLKISTRCWNSSGLEKPLSLELENAAYVLVTFSCKRAEAVIQLCRCASASNIKELAYQRQLHEVCCRRFLAAVCQLAAGGSLGHHIYSSIQGCMF